MFEYNEHIYYRNMVLWNILHLHKFTLNFECTKIHIYFGMQMFCIEANWFYEFIVFELNIFLIIFALSKNNHSRGYKFSLHDTE